MIQNLKNELNRIILGKEESVDLLIAALLADGHVLIEDVPGTGKTTLAKALAKTIGADFSRIQFTPDLLPADVTGGSIFRPASGTFELRKGPVFTQVLLADEINRASPRTQSALLEAMEERQVSLEGESHPLPALFMVLATENPIEYHGVFPLPEAQMDRFLMRISLGYPDADTEWNILKAHRHLAPIENVQKICTPDDILQMRSQVRAMHIEESLERYAVSLIQATRTRQDLRLPASPRAGIALIRTAQAFAFMDNKKAVTPDDIQKALFPVLLHRLTAVDAGENATKEILESIRRQIPIPK